MLLAVLCNDFELGLGDNERYWPEVFCIELLALGCGCVLA